MGKKGSSEKRGKWFIVLILLLAIVIMVAISFFNQPSETIMELKAVEVTDYEGEKLSSVSDFRENSIKGPQFVNVSEYRLEVVGLVDDPLSLSYDYVTGQFRTYRKLVRLSCVEGWSVDILWDGLLVRDIIKQAKPKSTANTVIFHAYDGYTTSFPLDYLMNNNIIMAYKMNNVTIPPERGFPFHLVAEDKWGYKWIKWITRIELSDDEDYEGYWESRGYSGSGNLDEGFLK